LIIFIFGLVPLKTEESQAFSLSAATLKKKYIFIAKNQFIRNPPITVLNKDTNWPIALFNYRVWNQIKNRIRWVKCAGPYGGTRGLNRYGFWLPPAFISHK